MNQEQAETVKDCCKIIVANYLKKNGFSHTLNAFLRESGQTSKVLMDSDNGSIFEALETLVGERIEFGQEVVAQEMQKLTVNDRLVAIDTRKHFVPSWNHLLKFSAVPLAVDKDALPGGLPLSVSWCDPDDSLIISTSIKEVCIYKEGRLYSDLSELGKKNGIIRQCGSIGHTGAYYLCCLDGTLLVVNEGTSDYKFKLHQRIISHISFVPQVEGSWVIVSCGLDNYLKLHKLDLATGDFEELWKVKLLSPCTSLQIARKANGCGSSDEIMIFLTRQDYTHVMCYTVARDRLLLTYKIALNNSQFNAFSFNVRDMVILGDKCIDGIPQLSSRSTLAVATSHIPYMRLLLVEIPTWESAATAETTEKTFYDKMLRNMATEVSQDSYSQPILRTLGNGNGGILVGGNQGLYAIDILRSDSWLITDIPEVFRSERIKCMETNKSGNKLAIFFSNRSSCIFKVAEMVT
ncbi:hypothetical protein HG535_0F01280 [Zygotorulaspora mrakii]|uniref:Uncharacterized protein n=1 Tax=Zygotorulaspora mrakii TaxID=42260 RepID=A0A7H9B4Z8_ZYGMR|nr:uncharacterized protein HG535_0F01280 [Zygotorulaspora mrakii]QLG73617.1 hypothetical protein HG535_0F01280 [Zygotorulaspora mrakii]